MKSDKIDYLYVYEEARKQIRVYEANYSLTSKCDHYLE